jgi:16S rRNA (cytosine967-C5)-methyltransferase
MKKQDLILISNDRSRLHAYNIVLKYESSKVQLKAVRQEYFNKNKLSTNERNRSMALSNEVIRWKRTLDEWISMSLKKPIKKLPLNALCILRLGYYEYIIDDFVPAHAAVDTWVELSKKLKSKKISGLINAVLRKARYIDKSSNDLKSALGLQFSFQDWMVQNWTKKYGQTKTIELCKYFNNTHEVDLRVDISNSNIKRLLRNKQIKWSFSPFSKNFIRIKSGLGDILSSNIFSKGNAFVQDRAAGAVIELLDPRPGEVILDVCAAPGTKSIYIHEKLKGEGQLFSYDINQSKIDKAQRQSKELGLDIKWEKKNAVFDTYPKADKILIDAPCSGTGVIARKPDIKWERNFDDVGIFSSLQTKIIKNVSKYLKKNGTIVYSTCSLESQENWDVVCSFLKFNTNFKLKSAERLIPDQWMSNNNCLETFPPRDNVDGMFAAKIIKC